MQAETTQTSHFKAAIVGLSNFKGKFAMATVPTTTVFPNAVLDADGITIPWTDLDGVTQAEGANAGVLLRGFVSKTFTVINALPANDKPSRFSIARGTQTATPNLLNALRQPYTITFDTTAAEFELAAE